LSWRHPNPYRKEDQQKKKENNTTRMDEDMQLALAISLSMQHGGDAEQVWTSSSQSPQSTNLVGVESQVVASHRTSDGKVIQVRSGDMTKEKVDVIVNAANRQLDHASGLAGAIVKKGGDIIQIESDIHIHENGKVHDGDIVVTGAGELPAKKVIHAVGPIWHDGIENEELLLRQCVWKSLKKTQELGFSSISIPAISSGIFK